ncbi:unnamed protein product [Mycena citricolor]|uniref:Nitroreductase domain-containing protein n=1 Tax=Mycena citricolor TaxID=2018698 RepID=A0AAD2JVV2_9AGAR|nr:unnamed protein product [Mycena citricolor]
MSASYLAAIATRRTRYALTDKSTIPDDKIEYILKECLLHTPYGWDSNCGRLVLMVGEKHRQLWSLIRESVTKGLEGDHLATVQKRIDGFHAAYGSVLFWDDQAILDGLIESMPPKYTPVVPILAAKSAGMLQSTVWTALAMEGMGASLQHNAYDPAVAEQICATFGFPKTWRSTAIMPFGIPYAPPTDKKFASADERFILVKD